MLRIALLVVAFSTLAACVSPDAYEQTTVPLGEGAVDLRFQPIPLQAGERVEFEAGKSRLTSVLRADGYHHVSLAAPGRDVIRVVGLLKGVPQYTRTVWSDDVKVRVLESGGHTAGGNTLDPPTSVHRETHCTPTSCTEIIEYDYDAVESEEGDASESLTGQTAWTPVGKATVHIDRLRYELRGRANGSASLYLPSEPELFR